MGLQYVDGRGIERTLTVADMATPDFQDAYSDLYKGINGFRPRGHSPEQMLHFFDTYEARYQEHEAEEAAALARRSEQDGIEYRSWSHYYDVKEAQDHALWEVEEKVRLARLAERKEFSRRGSPMPAIVAWEYGSL